MLPKRILLLSSTSTKFEVTTAAKDRNTSRDDAGRNSCALLMAITAVDSGMTSACQRHGKIRSSRMLLRMISRGSKACHLYIGSSNSALMHGLEQKEPRRIRGWIMRQNRGRCSGI